MAFVWQGFTGGDSVGQAGIQWDTHFIIDTNKAQGVGLSALRQTELTDDPTQKCVDLAHRYTLLPHYLTLRTQNTSWGRLYVVLFCAGLTITLARTTNIGANGSSTEYVCSRPCLQSMFVLMRS